MSTFDFGGVVAIKTYRVPPRGAMALIDIQYVPAPPYPWPSRFALERKHPRWTYHRFVRVR